MAYASDVVGEVIVTSWIVASEARTMTMSMTEMVEVVMVMMPGVVPGMIP